MRPIVSEVVLDASAFMALLNSEPGGEMVAEAIPEAAISAVNFSEVVAKLAENRGADEEAIRRVLQDFPFDIVPFDEEQAYEAGFLRPATRNLGLSLGDRACVGLARRSGAPVLTADHRWSRLSVGVDVTVIR